MHVTDEARRMLADCLRCKVNARTSGLVCSSCYDDLKRIAEVAARMPLLQRTPYWAYARAKVRPV